MKAQESFMNDNITFYTHGSNYDVNNFTVETTEYTTVFTTDLIRPAIKYDTKLIIFIAGATISTVVTVIGNILVFLSIITNPKLRTTQNIYLISLVCADLLVGLWINPLSIVNTVYGYWTLGGTACSLWLTCDILACTATTLGLCAIAFDRYIAISDPLHYAHKCTLKRVILSISVVWIISAIIAVPPIMGWNNTGRLNDLFNESLSTCEVTKNIGFSIYAALGSFYIPLVIMLFIYTKVYLITRQHLRNRVKHMSKSISQTELEKKLDIFDKNQSKYNIKSSGIDYSTPKLIRYINGSLVEKQGSEPVTPDIVNNNKPDLNTRIRYKFEKTSRISQQKEQRAACLMAIIMGVFVVCWLPFFTMFVLISFCDSCLGIFTDDVITVITWLGYVNSACNPIIYTIFNPDFRGSFKMLLTCACFKCCK